MDILLDAYAARSCPVKTQNQYDPTLTQPEAVVDEALTELFAGGKAFEDDMLAAICRRSEVLALRPQAHLWRQFVIEATLAALAAGERIIVGGRLPVDPVGGRRGQADLLVRGPDRSDGRPGYAPVEVKRHRVLEQAAPEVGLRFSRLESPGWADCEELMGWTFKPSRDQDLLQMAHYWRLLDATGHAAEVPLAGVIGTDILRPHAAEPVVSWVELTRKFLRTFSRTALTGWTLRSPLERYDHEFGFRMKVAERASQRTGGPDDPRQMVQPIVVRECEHCIWWEVCKPQLDDDDLSLRINKSPLDVREISVLRHHGINTLADLASADVEGMMEAYLPEVAHRQGADHRLRLAARRAALMLSGVELERLTADPIELPESDLEIDFDIETSAGDRVYLWGFLVHDRFSDADPWYHEVSSFTDLDNDSEVALARAAIMWLDQLLSERPGMKVYHYSDYEVVHLMRLARRSDDADLVAAAKRVRGSFVDLFLLIKQHFFGTNGLGLKVVARSGAGFEWRDDDPGGLNSQRWFSDALHGSDALARAEARRRVLEYNEDDVRATHQLRQWLRSLEGTDISTPADPE